MTPDARPDVQPALPLDGVPRRLLRATPSRLATFADCPRRYRLAYLTRPAPRRGGPWAHTSLGAAVHVALARLFGAPAARRTPLAAGGLLELAWSDEGFADEAQSARWRGLARGWVERYVAGLAADGLLGDDPPGVERTVALRTPALAFSGRIDRLDDRGGELVVVDYKTGRRPPTEQDARSSPALALYALAAAGTLRRACRRVELHGLRDGSVAAWEHSAGSLARQRERADAIGLDIVAASDTLAAGGDPEALFPPEPGPRCSWCDFRELCPEGAEASAARLPWDGLDGPAATVGP